MLPERRARAYRYEGAQRTAHLDVQDVHDGEGVTEEANATLLLDSRGEVVGVDVDPDRKSRCIVMHGEHEDVASTRAVQASVTRNARGDVCRVLVRGVDPPK